MEQFRIGEAMYRVQHRHKNGSWADMEEVGNHHDSTAHDPERGWNLRRLFVCRTCEEGVEMSPMSDERLKALR